MSGKENSADPWEFSRQMRKATEDYMLLLMEQYKTMRGIFGAPGMDFDESVMKFWPKGSDSIYRIFNSWMQNQMKLFETLMNEAIRDYSHGVSILESRNQDSSQFHMLLEGYTGLWIENYRQLKWRRDRLYQDSLDAMKKIIPREAHPVLEGANKWLMEQYGKLEEEMLQRIQRMALKGK